MSTTESYDKKNSKFWSFLCGTALAKSLGINEFNKEGLIQYDKAYFNIYPYLPTLIQFDKMKGQRVLEIGLGMGTVGRAISDAGADLTGLDISPEVIAFYKESNRLFGRSVDAVEGSAMRSPFNNQTFDQIVTIGCIHHTGSVDTCLGEISRILKSNGILTGMIYNRYSWRQWNTWPKSTFAFLKNEFFSKTLLDGKIGSDEQIAGYDANDKGEGAPFTEFYSRKMLRAALEKHGFKVEWMQLRNFDDYSGKLGRIGQRKFFLKGIDRLLGLDIYFRATKIRSEI